MSRHPRRDELEGLLRHPVDPLAAPPDAWERIDRRATRRKWAKASVAVAAAVIVIAGAVPAVIAVRHTSDNQTLAIGKSPRPGATAASHSQSASPVRNIGGIRGFFPESVSFVSQTEGFLWGSRGGSHRGIVAKTTNGGISWTALPSPAVNDSFDGDSQIRFATGDVGFVYGSRTFITHDGGNSWQPFPAPGYVADLEAANGHIWALVRQCETCASVRLYSATAAAPTLRRVTQVPVMHGGSGASEVASAASIAVSGSHVDVIAGSTAFWSTPDGRTWTQHKNPCPQRLNHGAVQSALVSSTTATGVLVACGYHVTGNDETKLLYASADAGGQWTRVPKAPSDVGYLQTLSAGGGRDIIVGTSHGGAQVSHDGGTTWEPDNAQGVPLSFVGFIDAVHIVAVADRAVSATGAFATSYDGGESWQLTTFP